MTNHEFMISGENQVKWRVFLSQVLKENFPPSQVNGDRPFVISIPNS